MSDLEGGGIGGLEDEVAGPRLQALDGRLAIVSADDVVTLSAKRVIKQLDKVAFVRFASVYRNFRDLDEFKDELNALLRNRE